MLLGHASKLISSACKGRAASIPLFLKLKFSDKIKRSFECNTDLQLKHFIFTSSISLSRGSKLRQSSEEKSDGSATGEPNVNLQSETLSPKELLENSVVDQQYQEGPYPHNSNYRCSQAKHSQRPKVDPTETSIILFPGQGTQYVGMGKELLEHPNTRNMFETASEILGYDLLELCLNGPEHELNQTIFQQPAVVVSSLAAVERLQREAPDVLENCVGTAGFSVGEITALAFAGAFSFEDAVRLVKARAEAMQLASELCPSGMMVVFYGPSSRVGFACGVAKEYCHRQGMTTADCRVASYLYPHCKVIAGNDEALQFIANNKEDFKLHRLKRLKVSGAFHTDLMKPAADVVKEALKHMQIQSPLIPVHSNIDGRGYKSAQDVRKRLPKQIYSPVKWEQTMHILYERHQDTAFPKTYECGPGKSLKSILKMINSKACNSLVNIVA